MQNLVRNFGSLVFLIRCLFLRWPVLMYHFNRFHIKKTKQIFLIERSYLNHF